MAKRTDEPEVVARPRFDPELDSVSDGDPTFELMLNPDTIPSDAHCVWVKQSDDPNLDDVVSYQHKRYVVARGDTGIEMLSGVKFADAETIRFRDHVLMIRDKEYHNRRETAERKRNAEERGRMLSSKRIQGDIFIGTDDRPGGRRARAEFRG